ncbi:MAG: FAD-dependent oxidoreductase [Pseudomonadota bacterium]|nr:FAD-dependent oxidoreductase [Pseudomonadota bacterium]
MQHGVIIIGTGLAGYMLAKEWRKLDNTTPLTIITKGKGDFYSKPLLSTALTHAKTPDVLPTASAEQMAEQLSAKILRETTVTRIDAENKTVHVDGEILAYNKLVLAFGADVIMPPLQGDAVDDVLSVNSIEDYVQFRDALSPSAKIIILGAGLVGCEFANDLANVQHPVHVVAPAEYPVDRLLTPELGNVVKTALSSSGVIWHLQQTAVSINHHNNALHVTLSDGTLLEADVVLSAIGLRPHIELAQSAGLRVARGVMVNRQLRTSDENIFALGDCAEVCGVVLQYIAPLLACTRALAKTLHGEPTDVVYPAMPVVLKTPACPVVVAPAPQDVTGKWQLNGEGVDWCALFHDQENRLRGFALTGVRCKERAELQKQLPPVFG